MLPSPKICKNQIKPVEKRFSRFWQSICNNTLTEYNSGSVLLYRFKGDECIGKIKDYIG